MIERPAIASLRSILKKQLESAKKSLQIERLSSREEAQKANERIAIKLNEAKN